VEFASDLFDQLRPDPESIETTGLLYGIKRGCEVRVISSRPQQNIEPVGIFVSRLRGEVFLTESNLEFFERQSGAVALAIAGSRAGFFVREPDGSFQAVRSYEEFHIQEPSAERPTAASKLPPKPPLARYWAWVAGLALSITVPVAALAYFHPRAPQPLALQVREQAGELHIAWQAGQTAVLEIADSGGKTSIPVFPRQSSVTYRRRGAEVEVNLIHVEAGNAQLVESARFVGPPLPLTSPSRLRAQVTHLQREAQTLRMEIQRNRARADALQKKLSRITGE
jgi:hypothetical protein